MTDDHTHRRYAAVRHVLTSSRFAGRAAPYLRDGRIDWYGLLGESATMSGGERFLVDVAQRLWRGDAVPTEYELAGQLDPRNAMRVAEAVAYLDESQHPDLAIAA